MPNSFKIKYLFTLFLLLIFANLLAQDEISKVKNQSISFSTNIGISFSRPLPIEYEGSGWTNYDKSFNANNGLVVGISATKRFGDAVFLELGVNADYISYDVYYLVNESDKWGSRITTEGDYRMQIGYIQPVLLPRIQFGGKVQFVFGLGVCFNIPIFSQIVGTYSKIGYDAWPGASGQYNTVLENNKIANNPRFFYEPIINLKINFPVSNQLFGLGVSYKSSLSYYISDANYYDRFARDQIITSIYYSF